MTIKVILTEVCGIKIFIYLADARKLTNYFFIQLLWKSNFVTKKGVEPKFTFYFFGNKFLKK